MTYTYHPMQMHLHTCHQPGASMASHMYNARDLGMHYIRFTDHDVRTGPKKAPCLGFDFTCGNRTWEDLPGSSCGWEETYGQPEITFDGSGMCLSVASESETCQVNGVGFVSSAKRHTASLLAGVTLTLALTAKLTGDARLVLDVRLSQRPPDHEKAHLRYVLGALQDPKLPHAVELPLAASEDGLYRLALSKDAQRGDIRQIVGGLDNAFDSIAILLETGHGTAQCRISHFSIQVEDGFQTVVERQRLVAAEVGKEFGIQPFVTTEISAAGNHKNCFSTAVPVIDYAARNYRVTQAEAIAHVLSYGGIFSYNHPFEKYKRSQIPPEQIPFIVRRDAAAMIASRVWGASLLEVGFVHGRAGFGLAEHLQLWDLLSMGGVFITGYGDSDSHNSDRGWYDGHNFAAWIAADAQIPFPVPEEVFIDSMKAGRLYTGDPVFLKGSIDFRCGHAPMGAVIPISDRDHEPRKVTFTAQAAKADWTVRIVADGAPALEGTAGEYMDAAGTLILDVPVAPVLPVSFVRAELYNAEGRCVLLTNPIYLVRTAEYAGELPRERLYEEGGTAL